MFRDFMSISEVLCHFWERLTVAHLSWLSTLRDLPYEQLQPVPSWVTPSWSAGPWFAFASPPASLVAHFSILSCCFLILIAKYLGVPQSLDFFYLYLLPRWFPLAPWLEIPLVSWLQVYTSSLGLSSRSSCLNISAWSLVGISNMTKLLHPTPCQNLTSLWSLSPP